MILASLRGRLVLTLGVWLMLGQVDGVLSSLHGSAPVAEGLVTPVIDGYGANAFFALSPGGLQTQVMDLLSVWQKTQPVSQVAFAVYTALDLVFIALYVWLLLSLLAIFRQFSVAVPATDPAAPKQQVVKRAYWFVVALAAFDMVEDGLRPVSSDSASPWFVYSAWGASLLKFLTLACVVLLVFVAWRQVPREHPVGRGYSAWALRRLRVPLVLLGAWGLFVMFDPTGQSADMFRRWLDNVSQFGESATFTLLGALLLGVAAWSTARRAVLAGYLTSQSNTRWGLRLVALTVVSTGALALRYLVGVFSGLNLLGFAVTLLIIFALDGFACLIIVRADQDFRTTRDTQSRLAAQYRLQLAGAPIGPWQDEVRRVARALATWPVVAVLVALASACTTPAVVLLAQGEDL